MSGVFFLTSYFADFARAFASRDFKRLALFFFITPVFAALSKALKAVLRDSWASPDFFSETSLRKDLTPFLYASFLTVFLALRVALWRGAFFADFVIGMVIRI